MFAGDTPLRVGVSRTLVNARNLFCHFSFSGHTVRLGLVGGRMYVRGMQGTAEIDEGLAMLRAGYATLAATDLDTLTAAPSCWAVLDALQTLTCQLPTQSHRMLARLQTEPPRGSWGPSPGTRSCASGGAVDRRSWAPAARSRRVGAAAHPDRATAGPGAARHRRRPSRRDDHRRTRRGDPHDHAPPARLRRPRQRRRIRNRPRPARHRGRAQGTARRRRTGPVPTRSGRPRTRRHRTRPKTRPARRQAGPRRDDPHQGPADPASVGDLGGDPRQATPPPACATPTIPNPAPPAPRPKPRSTAITAAATQRHHDALLAAGASP